MTRATPPDHGMIPVEQAAASLGITPARLRGFIMRDKVTDPVGDLHWVYPDTLASLRKRRHWPVNRLAVWPASQEQKMMTVAECRVELARLLTAMRNEHGIRVENLAVRWYETNGGESQIYELEIRGPIKAPRPPDPAHG